MLSGEDRESNTRQHMIEYPTKVKSSLAGNGVFIYGGSIACRALDPWTVLMLFEITQAAKSRLRGGCFLRPSGLVFNKHHLLGGGNHSHYHLSGATCWGLQYRSTQDPSHAKGPRWCLHPTWGSETLAEEVWVKVQSNHNRGCKPKTEHIAVFFSC